MNAKKLLAFSAMSLTLACAGEAKAETFSYGQFVTGTSTDWGSGGGTASLLSASYISVYAPTNQVLTVGVTTTPGEYYMDFTGPDYVLTYLPASGTADPLTASYNNPGTTTSGIFGGDVVALALNVDFSNAGLLGASTVPFGDLVLSDYTFDSVLNGLTVSQFLAVANTRLGGGACPGSLDTIDDLIEQLNLSFEAGTPDAFADDYLALPSSATSTPEPSSLLLLGSGLAGLALLRRRLLRASPPRSG